jgi:putative membrane protein insertion efficiency factor
MIKGLFLFCVRFYRAFISPLFPICCRYSPSCSSYMYHAIQHYGIIRGGWMGLKRLSRCHPWSKHPIIDPVPSCSDKKGLPDHCD